MKHSIAIQSQKSNRFLQTKIFVSQNEVFTIWYYQYITSLYWNHQNNAFQTSYYCACIMPTREKLCKSLRQLLFSVAINGIWIWSKDVCKVYYKSCIEIAQHYKPLLYWFVWIPCIIEKCLLVVILLLVAWITIRMNQFKLLWYHCIMFKKFSND